jgi:hypothetical protein
LLFATHLLYSGLGDYSSSYDSGVYLESARMIKNGFAPYRQVFSSQPPLWLPLLCVAIRLFGESFRAGQILMAIAGLTSIIAVMAMTKQLAGKGPALVTGALVAFSPLELEWSRTINADAPSIALATVALAFAVQYLRKGSLITLVSSALAIGCSMLVKLSGVYALPSLFAFVLVRASRVAAANRRRLRILARDVFLIAGVVGGIALLSFAFFGVEHVWDQVVAFHWAARKLNPRVSLLQRWRTLAPLIGGQRLLLATAPLSGLCLLQGLDGAALLTWPGLTFLALLYHRPLFDHHMMALIPGLAATSGVGAGSLGRLLSVPWRRRSQSPHPPGAVGAAVALGTGFYILTMAAAQAPLDFSADQRLVRRPALPNPDLRIAELIDRETRPGDMIITDAQGIAFLARRDVPPDLVDTSYTRIITGYLGPREVINQAQRYNVHLLLLWTSRLSLMPDVVRWAEKRFPQRIDLGDGRTLYLLR